MISIFIRNRRDNIGEKARRWRWRQRLEDVATSQEHLGPPEARRGKEGCLTAFR